MRRDLIYVAILWLVLTAIGEAWALNTNFMPAMAAEEAEIVDEAFRTLMIMGVPVAALVLAVLGYSFLRFRVRGEPYTDGPSVRNYQPLAVGWFVVTTALAVLVVFNPGLEGLNKLNADANADLVIQVEGEQWHWNVTYPQHDLSYARALQIALPVDTRVRFELTSKDVIHSFWIPAFRMKMDALPGRTTILYVTPTELGTFEDDPNLRVQCAELCGTGHAWMRMSVRIMEPAEFERWLDEAREVTSGGAMDMAGMDMGSGDGMDSTNTAEMTPEMDMGADDEMDDMNMPEATAMPEMDVSDMQNGDGMDSTNTAEMTPEMDMGTGDGMGDMNMPEATAMPDMDMNSSSSGG
ncbi:MAG: cytochrome c oxidase subunit II [Anaerolineae bacterium]|nr:cytochrome c oxidase subunit II [Anaerolineae bacterium]